MTQKLNTFLLPAFRLIFHQILGLFGHDSLAHPKNERSFPRVARRVVLLDQLLHNLLHFDPVALLIALGQLLNFLLIRLQFRIHPHKIALFVAHLADKSHKVAILAHNRLHHLPALGQLLAAQLRHDRFHEFGVKRGLLLDIRRELLRVELNMLVVLGVII